MNYKCAIEAKDIARIDKLNKLTDMDAFYEESRKLCRRVTSDHAIRSWQALCECRQTELNTIHTFEQAEYASKTSGKNVYVFIQRDFAENIVGSWYSYDTEPTFGGAIEYVFQPNCRWGVWKRVWVAPYYFSL